VLLAGTVWAEQTANPAITSLGVDARQTNINPGGNMEGKEVRFAWSTRLCGLCHHGVSNGSVNSMHDSNMPLGGMIPFMGVAPG